MYLDISIYLQVLCFATVLYIAPTAVVLQPHTLLLCTMYHRFHYLSDKKLFVHLHGYFNLAR